MERTIREVPKPGYVCYDVAISRIHLISNEALEYKVNVIDNIIYYCYNYLNQPKTEYGTIVLSAIRNELMNLNNNNKECVSSSLIGFILEDIYYSLLKKETINANVVDDIINKSIPYLYLNAFDKTKLNSAELLMHSKIFIDSRQEIRKSIKDIIEKNKKESTLIVGTFEKYKTPPKESDGLIILNRNLKSSNIISPLTARIEKEVRKEIENKINEEKALIGKPIIVNTAKKPGIVEKSQFPSNIMYVLRNTYPEIDVDFKDIYHLPIISFETINVDKERIGDLDKLFFTKEDEYNINEFGIKYPRGLFDTHCKDVKYVYNYINRKIYNELRYKLYALSIVRRKPDIKNITCFEFLDNINSELKNLDEDSRSMAIELINNVLFTIFSAGTLEFHGVDNEPIERMIDDYFKQEDDETKEIVSTTSINYYFINDCIDNVEKHRLEFKGINTNYSYLKYQSKDIVFGIEGDYIDAIKEKVNVNNAKYAKHVILTKDAEEIELLFIDGNVYGYVPRI